MREILFRGKTEKGEWVQGVPFVEEERCYIIQDLFICEEYDCTGAVNSMVIPETVGQYTGLTDKKGNKIFEGDIVIAPIYYDVGCYPHTESKIISVKIPEIYKMSVDGNFEIIGNIHDNPELLKGGE